MKLIFKEPAAAQSAPAAEQTPTMAMVPIPKDPAPPNPVTAGPPQVCFPQLGGEFTPADAAIPYLALGQKSGMLTEDHPDRVGQFIFDKTLPLGRELNVIVCRMRKFYEEKTEYGGSEIPRRFDKAAEASEANVGVQEVAEIDLLIEATSEAAQEHAVLDHAGQSFLAARYTVRSSAYRSAAGIIYRDYQGWLKRDLASGFYHISAAKRTGHGNTWYVPVLKTNGKVPAELRAKIKDTLGV